MIFFLTFSLPKCPTLISCNCDFIDLLLAVNKTPAKYFMLLLLLLMILMMMLKKLLLMGRRESPECFWNSINWTILQFLVKGRTVNADRGLICSTERVHCKTTIADVTRHPTDINQTTNQPTSQSTPYNFLYQIFINHTPTVSKERHWRGWVCLMVGCCAL